MFILAIVCAVKEGSLKSAANVYLIRGFVNVGAFGSAAFFGFALAIVYAILVGLAIIKIVRGGVNSSS